MPPHIVLVLPLYENASVKQLLLKQIRIAEKLRSMSTDCEDIAKRKEIETMRSIIMSPSTTIDLETKKNKIKDEEEENEQDLVSTKLCGDMELGQIKQQSTVQRRCSDIPPVRQSPSYTSISEKLNRNKILDTNKGKKRSSSNEEKRLGSSKKRSLSSKTETSQLSALVSQTTSTLLNFKLPLFNNTSEYDDDEDMLEDFSALDILNWNERLIMAVEISAAIEYLHKQNPPILHRDIKPANIMLDRNNRIKLGDFGESTTTGDGAKKRRKTKKVGRTMSIVRLGRRKSKQRERSQMEWEKSESWGDRLHQWTFVCFRNCGRHAGWLSASCFCAGVFFPIIFVSVAVARSVAFAGFGALIIIAISLVLLTDFLFHNIPRCEKFCSPKERKKAKDEDDLPRTIRGSPSWMVCCSLCVCVFFFFFLVYKFS